MIPNDLCIELYLHCGQCLSEITERNCRVCKRLNSRINNANDE